MFLQGRRFATWIKSGITRRRRGPSNRLKAMLATSKRRAKLWHAAIGLAYASMISVTVIESFLSAHTSFSTASEVMT
jgi:hypothetical protein